MKPREQRRKVMISARIQTGARWQDACILDISSKGLLVHTSDPPERGSYLELRRGAHVIVARVMWSGPQRCGLRSQDPLPVELLVSGADPAAAQAPPGERERRRAQRHVVKAEQSRSRGRAFEFAIVAMGGAACAGSAMILVQDVLARPLAAVQAVLEPSG